MMHIFVEGPDDERFFSKIYGKYWGEFVPIKYAGWTHQKINNFIRSIDSMPDCDYIFLGDADGQPINEKKRILVNCFPNLDENRIFIVQYEIESWYYAGISAEKCRDLKLKHYIYNTDALTKEMFNSKLPQRVDRKIIMAEILRIYELELALKRNASLLAFNNGIKKESA